MLLQFTLTGLILLSIPCRTCSVNISECKFSLQEPLMLERNAEFLIKSTLKTANQTELEDHLSVKSCHATQYAIVFVCTAEVFDFTIQEVCSNFISCLILRIFLKVVFFASFFRRIHHSWICLHSVLSRTYPTLPK